MSKAIRVLSWNLGGAPVPGGSSRQQQVAAWKRIRELSPDVALLQEVQEVQEATVPSWVRDRWFLIRGVVGRHGKRAGWGSVIAVRQELEPHERSECTRTPSSKRFTTT